jgi:GNAT superfamily N-acetyltransferase
MSSALARPLHRPRHPRRCISWPAPWRRSAGRQLAHQHVGQAHAALGHVLAHLLVEHRGEHLGLLVVHQAVLRRGVAHALHHHVDEHGFELRGRAAQWLQASRPWRTFQVAEALGIEREALDRSVFGAEHHGLLCP